MANYDYPRSWSEADGWLQMHAQDTNQKQANVRAIGKRTRLVRNPDNTISLIVNDDDLVTWWAGGRTKIVTRGTHDRIALARINSALPFGYRVEKPNEDAPGAQLFAPDGHIMDRFLTRTFFNPYEKPEPEPDRTPHAAEEWPDILISMEDADDAHDAITGRNAA